MDKSRRKFLEFLGYTGIALTTLPWLEAYAIGQPPYKANVAFEGLKFGAQIDDVVLAEGFEYQILASFGDKISDADTFGTHNDYLNFFVSEQDENEGVLWVNHEYFNSVLMQTNLGEKTKEKVDFERYVVGGSIVKIKKDNNNKWNIVVNDPVNRRLNGNTKIPFLWDEEIAGSKVAEGTFQNCAGGRTPWGTILTCEENYDYMYGEIFYDENNVATRVNGGYSWEKYYDNSPEHFGWVVEVNVETGEAQKLVALGRFKHECATVHSLKDGRVVIYSGDDEANQFIYKYVSDKPRDLKNGKLYAADTINGKWLLLDIKESDILKNKFKSQTEVLVRVREAAKMLGATPQNRPEDIEIDPNTGSVLIALANNKNLGDFHGSILKIVEDSADKTGLTFKSETFLAGGEKNMFSSPDNLAFDPKGNFWFTTDVSGSALGKGEYKNFIANGLYVVPRTGKRAGEIIMVATAPIGAELTGPYFHPNGRTLFLSVQHPGENSRDINHLVSNWPLGGNEIPKCSVITITGDSLDKLMQ